MIIVTAYAVVKPGMADEFVKAAQQCVAETRREKGNLSYTLAAGLEFPDRYSFFEEWESQSHLDAHMKTAHFQAFAKEAENLLAEPLVIKVYNAVPVK